MAYPKLNMVNKRLVHTYIIAKHVPRLWNSCILWVACGGHLRGACTIDHAGDCSRQCQKTSCLFRVTYQFTQQSMRDWNSLLNASSLYTKRRRHYWTTSLNAVWIHPYRHSSHEKRYKKTRGNLCTACMAMVSAALINYHCHRQPKPNAHHSVQRQRTLAAAAVVKELECRLWRRPENQDIADSTDYTGFIHCGCVFAIYTDIHNASEQVGKAYWKAAAEYAYVQSLSK